MKKILFPFALLMMLAMPLQAELPRDPYQFFFNDTFGDFSDELETARQDGKSGVLLFFEMDDCPFCHWMKQNVLNQVAVQEYYRDNFMMFSVDVEGDVEIVNFDGRNMSQKDFAFREHRVRATPALVFFDLEGNQVHRHTGRTSDPDEFLLMGKYVVDGVYKDMRFTRYKREQE
ncbi:MAG: thioredoxin family protein [Chromatiales bacterium]|nr:thioredoxin fold domain-containing protein [Gammaproteobacteria bacterium]MBW6476649.1 thioredoxin family protein [Chromatiales bacterium]